MWYVWMHKNTNAKYLSEISLYNKVVISLVSYSITCSMEQQFA